MINKQRLKERRKELHLTQAQLAKKAKISPSYVSYIERNMINPNYDILLNLCDALNISMSEITNNIGTIDYDKLGSIDIETGEIL